MEAQNDRSLEGFFKDRPRPFILFGHVKRFIDTLGPVKMEVMGTQVSFGTDRKFMWIWLPQQWIRKRQKDCIAITFAIPRRVQDVRIEETVEPRPGRWTHHILIENEDDMDDTVRDWLREAYSASRKTIDGKDFEGPTADVFREIHPKNTD